MLGSGDEPGPNIYYRTVISSVFHYVILQNVDFPTISINLTDYKAEGEKLLPYVVSPFLVVFFFFEGLAEIRIM